MTANSITTNSGAAVALQNLNITNVQIVQVEGEISTGLKIASPKDDGATWAISNKERADSNALGIVNQSLNRAKSAIDVALSAGQTISDTLNQMKALASSALDPTLDSTSRQALVDQYGSLKENIVQAASSADFNGINFLTASGQVSFLNNVDGTSTTAVQGADINYSPWTPGPTLMLRGYSLDTVTYAGYSLSEVDQSITNVNAALSQLGTSANEIESAIAFNGNLQDAINTGVGNLVDADLAQASAQLQALQTKQQLGAQALSIANSAPSDLLPLFKNIE